MPTISNAKDMRDDKEYTIQEIRSLKKTKPKKFEKIKPNLVCYECSVPQMIPKLGAVNEHHYAKSPKQNHSFDCYYFGDEYTQKEVDFIVSNIKHDKPSQHQVENAFNQIQKYLNRDKSSQETVDSEQLGDRIRSHNSQSGSKDNQRSSNSKYIPRKKLNKEISDDDEGVWKIYYGQVGMEYHSEKGSFENYFVKGMIGKGKVSYRLSIGIHQAASDYFNGQEAKMLDKVKKSKRLVTLMVLGKISKTGRYNNLAVYDSRLLHLETLSKSDFKKSNG
jgi:hypothetical protein